MDRETEILEDRVEVLALARRRIEPPEGFEVKSVKARKATVTVPWAASVPARNRAGSERRDSATSAPNSVRIKTQSSIEPS